MYTAGNPLVLATPTQRDPVERQKHAIERLIAYWRLIFREKDTSKSAEDILDLVESLQDDLGAIGAPDLPSRARKKQAELLHYADELKAEDIQDNWDATSTTDVSAGATRNWTAKEIEDEVDRRLSTEQDWRYRPLARDSRSTPKRFMLSLWKHYHEAWEFDSMSKEAEDHYLSLWRADEPFRYGVDPQQSPFAEILRDPNSEGTENNAVWRKVRDIKGGAQGKISLWRMTRQNGQGLYIILKDTSENEFFLDYCSEAFLTLRLNAVGCQNVITVLDWNYYNEADKKRFRICYEWAKYGDLSDLVGWYYDNKLIFPEAFIWHVFNSLARALVYCRNGGESPTRADQWEELVCGDLKEANTLVCKQDDEHRIYPCLKLADFGLAYPVPSKAVRDFKQSTPWGTSGYQAPEIQIGKDIDRNQRERHSTERRRRAEQGLPGISPTFDAADPRAGLGSHSDIWSLGATISNLMSLVNSHLRANDVRKLLHHGLRRCYYSRVLVGLVESCLENDYKDRLVAYDLYEITSYYAAQHKDLVYNAADDAARTGEPSYSQEVLLDTRQLEYQDDDRFREEYETCNLHKLHSLQDYLRAHNEDPLHPNETIAAPEHLDLRDIIYAGQLSRSPSPDILEQPFQFGYKPLISGVVPAESSQSEPDDDDGERGGGPSDPRPPHDGAPPAQQPAQQAAVDDQAPRPPGNVSRTRRPYPAPVHSLDSFAHFEPATLQRSPGSGDRPFVRRLRTVVDEQASIASNIPPANSQTHQSPPADESIVEQPGLVRTRSDLFTDDPPANRQTHQSPSDDEAPLPETFVSAAPSIISPRNAAPASFLPSAQAATSNAPQPQPNSQPRRSPSADEAEVRDPFYSAPPPPRSDMSAPSPPATQNAALDAPPPQAPPHPSSTPAAPIQRASSPPANAPPRQTPSQRSSTSSGRSSVPPGPIRTPSQPHHGQPSHAPPPPTSTDSSPLSSVPSTWPFSPMGPSSSPNPHGPPSTTSSTLTPVPPGPITRPFSALEERYLFRTARPARPARQVALQRLTAMRPARLRRVGRRGRRREVVEEVVEEVEGGGERKAERQAGEREERALKRRRGREG